MLESLVVWLEANPPGVWVYPALFVVALVETLFPPFPGDVLFVIAAGWAGDTAAHLSSAALCGLGGCLVSTLVLITVGRGVRTGRTGRFVTRHVGGGRLERAGRVFTRFGPAALVASRFLPGIRSLLVFVAGSSGMEPLRAFLCAGSSAAVWYALLAALAGFAGRNSGLAQGFLARYEVFVWAAMAAGVVVALTVRLSRRRKAP